MSEPPSATTTAIGAHPRGWPVVTAAMLVVLTGAFALEQRFAVRAPRPGLLAPHIRTLVAMGAMSRPLVLGSGEWWRLFASALLHVDALHLALNGVALLIAGALLEELIGRAWLLALCTTGVLAGSLVALAVNPSDTVTVGASGGVLALLVAAIVSAQRLPEGRDRRGVRGPLLVLLLPSLLPLVTQRTGGRIDWAAHTGGALVGVAGGVLLLRAWPRGRRVPGHHRAAAWVAAVGVAAIAVSAVLAATHYGAYREALGGT